MIGMLFTTALNIYSLAPLIIILLFIVAAAGLTRGVDIFSIFSIGALVGATAGFGSGGVGKGFRAGKTKRFIDKGVDKYGKNSIAAARDTVLGLAGKYKNSKQQLSDKRMKDLGLDKNSKLYPGTTTPYMLALQGRDPTTAAAASPINTQSRWVHMSVIAAYNRKDVARLRGKIATASSPTGQAAAQQRYENALNSAIVQEYHYRNPAAGAIGARIGTGLRQRREVLSEMLAERGEMRGRTWYINNALSRAKARGASSDHIARLEELKQDTEDNIRLGIYGGASSMQRVALAGTVAASGVLGMTIMAWREYLLRRNITPAPTPIVLPHVPPNPQPPSPINPPINLNNPNNPTNPVNRRKLNSPNNPNNPANKNNNAHNSWNTPPSP